MWNCTLVAHKDMVEDSVGAFWEVQQQNWFGFTWVSSHWSILRHNPNWSSLSGSYSRYFANFKELYMLTKKHKNRVKVFNVYFKITCWLVASMVLRHKFGLSWCSGTTEPTKPDQTFSAAQFSEKTIEFEPAHISRGGFSRAAKPEGWVSVRFHTHHWEKCYHFTTKADWEQILLDHRHSMKTSPFAAYLEYWTLTFCMWQVLVFNIWGFTLEYFIYLFFSVFQQSENAKSLQRCSHMFVWFVVFDFEAAEVFSLRNRRTWLYFQNNSTAHGKEQSNSWFDRDT